MYFALASMSLVFLSSLLCGPKRFRYLSAMILCRVSGAKTRWRSWTTAPKMSCSQKNQCHDRYACTKGPTTGPSALPPTEPKMMRAVAYGSRLPKTSATMPPIASVSELLL